MNSVNNKKIILLEQVSQATIILFILPFYLKTRFYLVDNIIEVKLKNDLYFYLKKKNL